MKRVIFFHSQTLYAKVSIPLALRLAEQGIEVHYLKNRPELFRFSLKNIINNPVSVNFMNLGSLGYVAKHINYTEEFGRLSGKLNTTFSRNFRKYDAVISTTKNLPELREISTRSGIPAFALGYQHLPVIAKVNGKFRTGRDNAEDSVFFGDNAFARDHGFKGLFDKASGVVLNNFTYLDKVFGSMGKAGFAEKDDTVLIFHPGGYRNVITRPGASRKVSYERQKDFLAKTCIPLLSAGLRPVVKVHPLHARYHGLDDLGEIASETERSHRLGSGAIVITDDWFWNRAFKASFILTFGSSSIYELWAAGVKRVYVCNFFGEARSKRFNYFPDIYLNTHNEYLDLVRDRRYETTEFDKFTMQVIKAYSGLFDGNAVNRAAGLIADELTL